MEHPTTFIKDEGEVSPEEYVDAEFPDDSTESFLDINLTEASVYLELAMEECDDSEIAQDIMRSYRSLITALTKAQERRDDGS